MRQSVVGVRVESKRKVGSSRIVGKLAARLGADSDADSGTGQQDREDEVIVGTRRCILQLVSKESPSALFRLTGDRVRQTFEPRRGPEVRPGRVLVD